MYDIDIEYDHCLCRHGRYTRTAFQTSHSKQVEIHPELERFVRVRAHTFEVRARLAGWPARRQSAPVREIQSNQGSCTTHPS